MDALTLVHCLRNQGSGRELYIVMVGPRDQAGALEASFGAGADDFLAAPVRSGELLSRLRGARRFIELLEQWRSDHGEMRRLAAMLADANTRLESLVETDELTGIPNRRRASEQLVRAVADAEEASTPLSVFLLDLDNFRAINSTWGEGVGDEVLRRTARTLQGSVRSGDVVARFAGQEFMVIAPGMPAAAATAMAERLRLAISQQTVRIAETEVNVTLSVGASVYEPAVSRRRTPEGLLHLADEALLRAKDSGRNRVCIATERPAVSG
jgi:diguanylate cyclase (GGDEF)-like protein